MQSKEKSVSHTNIIFVKNWSVQECKEIYAKSYDVTECNIQYGDLFLGLRVGLGNLKLWQSLSSVSSNVNIVYNTVGCLILLCTLFSCQNRHQYLKENETSFFKY